MQETSKNTAWLTIRQITERREAARRKQRWGLPFSAKIKKELQTQLNTELERDLINILDCSQKLTNREDHVDTPEARLLYEQTAKDIMNLSTDFMAMEVLKQASASIYSEEPELLGVDLQHLEVILQASLLVQHEQDCLPFLKEAIAIKADPKLRFTVTESITGAIADRLNFTLESNFFQARFARHESTQIELAILTPSQPLLPQAQSPVRI